jgi:predicted DNA-binding antitoxin AbrB/MazE fold protein
MTTVVRAIYEDGVFKPLEPIQLDELTQVEVLVPLAATAHDKKPAAFSAWDDLIGLIRDAPADMAEHHDRYLSHQPNE